VQSDAALTQTKVRGWERSSIAAKWRILPLNGRDFAQLRASIRESRYRRRWRAAGGEGNVSGLFVERPACHFEQFLVDGVDNTTTLQERRAVASIDSIQEFEVQTNTFAAEYGRNTGSVVNLVTIPGPITCWLGLRLFPKRCAGRAQTTLNRRNFRNQDCTEPVLGEHGRPIFGRPHVLL